MAKRKQESGPTEITRVQGELDGRKWSLTASSGAHIQKHNCVGERRSKWLGPGSWEKTVRKWHHWPNRK